MNNAFTGPFVRLLLLFSSRFPAHSCISKLLHSPRPSNCFFKSRDCPRSHHFHHATYPQAPKRNFPSYLLLLKTSASLPSHPLATSLHAHILKSGFQNDPIITTALIHALSRCSDINTALNVFDQMPKRDIAAWNTIISGCARNGLEEKSLALFHQMGSCGTRPNSLTLSIMLQVCGGFEDKYNFRRQGKCIHAYICKQPEVADTFLYNSLIVYYFNSGDLIASEAVFERMAVRDIVSWNSMMSGYLKAGSNTRALGLFGTLRQEGLMPDLVTFEMAFQACANIGEDVVNDGEAIHALFIRIGLRMDVYAENTLLLMYSKYGRMDYVQSLFDHMHDRNIVSWNILVGGYVQSRNPEMALVLFECVRSVESEMSSALFSSALRAVRLIGDLKLVSCVHGLIIVTGFESDVYVSSSLISAYGEMMEVGYALRCLDQEDGLVCWNTMLSVYVCQGYYSEAVELIRKMQLKAITLDTITIVNALSICTQCQDLDTGKAIHGYIIRNRLESGVFVITALLKLYTRCGLITAACRLFSNMRHRNIVSWNTMIHGCLQNGFPGFSIQLFHQMQQQDGLVPDATSVVGVIEAIALRGYDKERDYVHEYVVKNGFGEDEFVANSLISMHARFNDFKKAHMVFDRVSKPTLVSWNTIIAEYSKCGQESKAISFFHQMKLNNVATDSVTLLCLLRACLGLGSLNCVMWTHAITSKAGCESDILVGTSLVDTYAKCGGLSMARVIFDNMKAKSVISWNTMIQGYGMHGNAEEASRVFSQMQLTCIDPTIVTFLALISACSHTGDVEMGRYYLDLMSRAYPFLVRKEHLSCFIDLLGRRGLFNEAYDYLEKMQMNDEVCTWGAVLAACRVHGNLELGSVAAERLFELDPYHCGYNFLLSNMYVEAGRWMDASLVKHNFNKTGFNKVQACSMVESS